MQLTLEPRRAKQEILQIFTIVWDVQPPARPLDDVSALLREHLSSKCLERAPHVESLQKRLDTMEDSSDLVCVTDRRAVVGNRIDLDLTSAIALNGQDRVSDMGATSHRLIGVVSCKSEVQLEVRLREARC